MASAANVDQRNKDLLAYVNGTIVPRAEASINIWDSGFLHGKQIWTSPRLVKGKIFRLDDHLEKMLYGIQALHCPVIPKKEDFIDAIRQALEANRMQGASGVHIRIIFTPGTQVTASMNNHALVNWDGTPSKPSILVMPEWRANVYSGNAGKKAIISKLYRRPSPEFADQRIHSNNQIHSSLACDEANKYEGVTATILLDPDGYIAETHASHLGIVDEEGTFFTPLVKCCPPGVTRQVLLELCQQNGIKAQEDNITPERLLKATEVMILGTMSGPISIVQVDDVIIGNGKPGPVTQELQQKYEEAMGDDQHLFDIFNS